MTKNLEIIKLQTYGRKINKEAILDGLTVTIIRRTDVKTNDFAKKCKTRRE